MTDFDAITAPLPQRLADGLARLAAVARQLEWRAAEAVGLTPTQADILALLARRPEGVRLALVAAHLGVRGPTASDAVTALVRKGLVARKADPEDGRAVRLVLTQAGGSATAARVPGFAAVVAGLAPDAQRALLAQVVTMIRDLLERDLIAPQRICVTCRHFRENARPGSDKPHFCALVGAAMADHHLRLDCPEHQPAIA